jgi:hypothetical protein
MPEQATSHYTELWTAFTVSVAGIVSLVAVLYNRLNKDLKAHDDKFDVGQETFIKLGEELVKLGERMSGIVITGNSHTKEITDIRDEIKEIVHQLTVLQTEHNKCPICNHA